MKRSTLVFFALSALALTSCKQTYTLTIEGHDYIIVEDAKIKASDPRTAYMNAVDYVNGVTDALDNYFVTYSFTLQDKKGNFVSYPEIKATFEQKLEFEQKKAFMGTTWGMSKDEVKANLESFDLHSYEASDGSIRTSRQIGKYRYAVLFGFKNGGLCQVNIKSTDSSYETISENLVLRENELEHALVAAFKEPHFFYHISDEQPIEEVLSYCSWYIGDKVVTLGYDKRDSAFDGEVFCAQATLYSVSKMLEPEQAPVEEVKTKEDSIF